MIRFFLPLPLVVASGAVGEEPRQARAGDPRGHEADILLDTFGFGPDTALVGVGRDRD